MPTLCSQLRMLSADGKRYKTDVADTAGIFRIIQAIPSPKAEPFKLWLAQVGKERVEETIDPELSIDRALNTYAQLGYSAEWINQRIRTIQARKELTDAIMTFYDHHSYPKATPRADAPFRSSPAFMSASVDTTCTSPAIFARVSTPSVPPTMSSQPSVRL